VLEKGLVNITMIEAPGCDECNMGGAFIEQVKAVLLSSDFLEAGASRSIPLSSPEAAALVSRYNITELPAIIIEGPVERDGMFMQAWGEGIGSVEGGALVSRMPYPPYYDMAQGMVYGLSRSKAVMATGCLECSDPGLFIGTLEGPSFGMVFTSSDYYDADDAEALSLIEKYNITCLPVIMMEAEGASAYPVFGQLSTFGTLEDDGWFVLRDVPPPYIDLADNGSVKGRVHAVFLTDPSCTDCLNVSVLSSYIADSAGLVIVEERFVETNSADGADMISKYNITAVPAILYSPDASYYPGFDEAWLMQNSTKETDGWYVFRAHGLLGDVVYRNITGG
jgi:hypothetical protein